MKACFLTGHIRTTEEVTDDEKGYDGTVFSLSLFPSQQMRKQDDDRLVCSRHEKLEPRICQEIRHFVMTVFRTFYRFDASWDSSMHNSQLLNNISSYGERVYITVTAYVQIDNCSQPAVISKDLCLVIHGRDSKATSAGYRLLNSVQISVWYCLLKE